MREIAALLLAGVLVAAGGAKLLDPGGTRRTARELGVPSVLGWPIAIGLPLLELALAVGLILPATSRAAAVAAACLMTVFAAVIAVNVLRGRRVDCGCFGRLHSSGAGYPAVARNAVLASLAVMLAIAPAGRVGWLELGAALVVTLLAGQAALWVITLTRYGRVLRRIDELTASETVLEEPETKPLLDPGDTVPTFALRDGVDESRTLHELLAEGRPLVLVATDERCGSCAALYPDLARWQEEFAGLVTIAVLGLGDADSLAALAQEHGLDIALVADPATFEALGVEATPGALVVGPDGLVASPFRYGSLDIEMLVLDTVEATAPKEVAQRG